MAGQWHRVLEGIFPEAWAYAMDDHRGTFVVGWPCLSTGGRLNADRCRAVCFQETRQHRVTTLQSHPGLDSHLHGRYGLAVGNRVPVQVRSLIPRTRPEKLDAAVHHITVGVQQTLRSGP